MKIKVNGRLIEIFKGATAKDAVRRFFVTQGQSLNTLHTFILHDSYGHEIDLDAPLYESTEITVIPRSINESKL